MANSVDSDQKVSAEASWSGSTLFAKAGHIWVQQEKGKAELGFPIYQNERYDPKGNKKKSSTTMTNRETFYGHQALSAPANKIY